MSNIRQIRGNWERALALGGTMRDGVAAAMERTVAPREKASFMLCFILIDRTSGTELSPLRFGLPWHLINRNAHFPTGSAGEASRAARSMCYRTALSLPCPLAHPFSLPLEEENNSNTTPSVNKCKKSPHSV